MGPYITFRDEMDWSQRESRSRKGPALAHETRSAIMFTAPVSQAPRAARVPHGSQQERVFARPATRPDVGAGVLDAWHEFVTRIRRAIYSIVRRYLADFDAEVRRNAYVEIPGYVRDRSGEVRRPGGTQHLIGDRPQPLARRRRAVRAAATLFGSKSCRNAERDLPFLLRERRGSREDPRTIARHGSAHRIRAPPPP